MPGDTLRVCVTDPITGKTDQFDELIGRDMIVDTVVTFELDEPEFGLSDGIGAVFGQKCTN